MKIWWQSMHFVTAMQNEQGTPTLPTMRWVSLSPHLAMEGSQLLMCCNSKQVTARIRPLSISLASLHHTHVPGNNISVLSGLWALNTWVVFSRWILQGFASAWEPALGLDFIALCGEYVSLQYHLFWGCRYWTFHSTVYSWVQVLAGNASIACTKQNTWCCHETRQFGY